MSRDIRSYFSSKPTPKPVNDVKPLKRIKKPLSSSDEEDSVGSNSKSPPKNKIKPMKNSSKHVLSDSDDDETFRRSKNNRLSPIKNKKPEKEKETELKPVTLDSIFSKNPVKRKNVETVSSKKLVKEESAFHDDDDFEATLNGIDTEAMDSMYSKEDKKKLENKGNSKRKPSDSDNDTPSKKVKLSNGDEKISDRKVSDDKIAKASKSTKLNIEITVEKKKRKEKDLDESIADPFEENILKKKQHSAMYQQYLQRGGARNPGSKTIPDGATNCLAGLTFVVTGVLDSLERHEADELIKQYGGRVVAAISKKTDYLMIGEEAGQSKISKADSLGIKKITEDDLLELVRTRPEGKASNIIRSRSHKKKDKEESVADSNSFVSPPKKEKVSPDKFIRSGDNVKLDTKSASENLHKKSPDNSLSPLKRSATMPAKMSDDAELSSSFVKKVSPKELKNLLVSRAMSELKPQPSFDQYDLSHAESINVTSGSEAQALVEKYRPKTMKQIIGQHTFKSSAKKLHLWLMNWHKNHSGNVKLTKPSPWAKNDDGAFFKAALLSGPPGIGKTTTVQVVCKELNFDLVEFNASDTRSKRLLKEDVSTLLSNTSVKGYFSSGPSKTSTQHVLLMDEVDGMAGNEDRGGLQELINLIKSTDVPIVCICNDRNHTKMRTLANYTFDLRFQKPKLEQIRGAMKSLCCKEDINISTENLDRLIQSTNFDIRQVINHLAILSSEIEQNEETDKERIKQKINKDLKLGPWDVCRKVFNADEHKTMSIHDKSDLFFHDYNIAGLFVQENYLSVVPKAPKTELLDRIAAAADSLAIGDVIEKSIRQGSGWSLLPVQAWYSSVIPGSMMSGYITSQINFPSWLGRNSKRMKFDRLLQEITVHTRLVTGASKEAINIDYLIPLRDKIMRPLVTQGTDGVNDSIDAMNHYHLLRDDLDGLVEISLWPNQRDPMQLVDSKVKAAFTRSYNKNSIMTPFAIGAATSKKKEAAASQDEGFITGDGEEDDDGGSDKDHDDIDIDRMVKAKKPSGDKNTASTSKDTKNRDKPVSKRGRGRGRGK